MIRKLLCWLGWHEWKPDDINCSFYLMNDHCGGCKYCQKICKHCGAIKK